MKKEESKKEIGRKGRKKEKKIKAMNEARKEWRGTKEDGMKDGKKKR